MQLTVGKITDIVTFTRASGGTYFDQFGVLQMAAVNEWRRDHDPVTHEARGILIEEAATNVCLHSGAVGDASKGWGLNNCSATLNAATAPDGTQTATLITSTTDRVGECRPRQDGRAVPANTGMEISCFVKKTTKSSDFVQFFNNYDYGTGVAYADGSITANIETGEIVARGSRVTSAGVEECGDGWKRVWLVYDGTGNVRPTTNLYLNMRIEASNTADLGQELLYWGGSIVTKAVHTSYIPTTTAAATRAADFCIVPAGSFNGQEHTLFAEVIDPRVTGVQTTYANLTADANNRHRLSNSASSGALVSYGLYGGTAVQLVANAIPYGSRRIAAGIGLASQALAANGVIQATSAIAIGGISGAPQLVVGGYSAGSSIFNGHIKRIAYFPRRLSNAELQEITA